MNKNGVLRILRPIFKNIEISTEYMGKCSIYVSNRYMILKVDLKHDKVVECSVHSYINGVEPVVYDNLNMALAYYRKNNNLKFYKKLGGDNIKYLPCYGEMSKFSIGY